MKKSLKIVLIVMLSFFLFAGGAQAWSITEADNTIAWPGYFNPAFPNDEYGSPKIQTWTITTYANGDLASVVLNISANLLIPDALLINNERHAGDTYEGWDYYVKANYAITPANPNGRVTTLFEVDEDAYSYTWANLRIGHPAGLVLDGALTAVDRVWTNFVPVPADPNPTINLLTGYTANPGVVTYSFAPGIHLGDGFVIAYTQYCANDVIITPEPLSLLLLGLGLIGVAGIRRKIG